MKLLLFDIDGTILSTDGAGSRAVRRAFEKVQGVDAKIEMIDFAGKTDPLILKDIYLNALGREHTPKEEEKVYFHYIEYLREEIKTAEIDVKPGIRKLLHTLSDRDDILLGLGTGNIEQGARIKLGQVGLNDHFKFGGFGCDSEHRTEVLKQGIERAHKHTNTGFTQTFVIGDTPHDINHGKAAGARVVAVATGYYSKEELIEHGPDYFYEDLSDTESVISIFN